MRKEINGMPLDDDEGITFCDIIGCRLMDACQIKGCAYHIDDASNKNCIRQLKANTSKKPTQAAIASALQMSVEAMRETLASAFAKMRRSTLVERLHETNTNSFGYVTNAKVCVACASRVEDSAAENHTHEIVPGHNVYYCSRACEQRRPIAQIKLEMEYRSDIGDILISARKLFKRLDTIQATLNVRKTHLIQWYETLLGVRPYEFGVDAAVAVDVLRKSTRISPEDSFVSILSIDKTNRWWVDYDAKIQATLLSI